MYDEVSSKQEPAAESEEILCPTCWPPGLDERVQDALTELLNRVGGQSAGVNWLVEPTPGTLRLQTEWSVGQSPSAETLAALADLAALNEIVQGGKVAGWLGAPVEMGGETAGRLWVVARPGERFDKRAAELTAMTGRQLGLLIANARMQSEIERLKSRRKALLRRVVVAQDERCRHFARELHDEVCQSLTALSIDLEAILVSGQPTSAALSQRLEHVRNGILRAVEEAERIILGLRPLLLEDLGLVAALYSYAQQRLSQDGVQIHLEENLSARRLPPHLEIILYRIGQEALSNVALHADAHNVWLGFSCDDRQTTLAVRDDGRGFQIDQTAQVQGGQTGLGLLGMKERASLVGGRVEITSAPGEGTCVVASVAVNDNGR